MYSIIEGSSSLKYNIDFFAGYSPERINPGDKSRTVKDILKITSGSNEDIASIIDALYASIITAGTYKASSIKVAEAAKVIENVQRDVNIGLINELALLFNRLNIDTEEVLKAVELNGILNLTWPSWRTLHRNRSLLFNSQSKIC